MKTNSPVKFRQRDHSFIAELDKSFSIHLPANTASQQLKTAPLQKGLTLYLDGHELVEEGMGFGVPVIKYGDNVYFSKDAEILSTNEMRSVNKHFQINSIEEIKLGEKVSNGFAFPDQIWKVWAYLYRSSEFFSKLIINIDQKVLDRILWKNIGAKAEFITVESKGKVSINYETCRDKLHILCDFTELDGAGCQRIFVLNEQGPGFFRKYEDSDGTRLVDGEISAWRKVKSKEARLSDINPILSFRLCNIDGAHMWVGREVHANVAW